LIDKETIVKAKGPTKFADRYNLNTPRLAIRFYFLNNPTEYIKINGMDNKSIFFSNFLVGGNSIFD
jgi:hypothetical protein